MSDDRLRERFRALRREEAGSESSLESTLARAWASEQPVGLARRPWLPALAGAAALVVGALAWQLTRPAPLATEFDPGRWRTPSDALLQGIPGTRLLYELPTIGTPIDPPSTTGRAGSHWRMLS